MVEAYWIRRRSQTVKGISALVIGIELSSQIMLRLILILLFVVT